MDGTATPAHSSSATARGVLVYGTRRIHSGSASVFKADFEEWAQTSREHMNAAFAFPDPADVTRLHCVFWTSGDLHSAGPATSEAYASASDDPDMFDVYGEGQVLGPAGPALHCNKNLSLGGFIRDASEYAASSAAASRPMIGIFKRAIRPGQLDSLAASFQVVCDIWHKSIPGMLASSVSRDPVNENFVHDIRIFADSASYAAHVDKSNEELTRAMEAWFEHYDTSVPHRGALFKEAPTAGGSANFKSSVKDKPVKLAFNTFHYGQNGMVGFVEGVGYPHPPRGSSAVDR